MKALNAYIDKNHTKAYLTVLQWLILDRMHHNPKWKPGNIPLRFIFVLVFFNLQRNLLKIETLNNYLSSIFRHKSKRFD